MKVKAKEIKVGLGLSVDIDDVWYRPNCTITLELEDADTKEERAKVFKQAFDEVTESIEEQIMEIAGEE